MKKSKDQLIRDLREQLRLELARAERIYSFAYNQGRADAMNAVRAALGLSDWRGNDWDAAVGKAASKSLPARPEGT